LYGQHNNTCSKTAFRKYLWQTLTHPDKILQAYVGWTQISCENFGTLCQRGTKWWQKGGCFL